MGRIGLARIEFGSAENDSGIEVDCVDAYCLEGLGQAGPIWGHGAASVLRALATLTEECDCGVSFHIAAEDDEDVQ